MNGGNLSNRETQTGRQKEKRRTARDCDLASFELMVWNHTRYVSSMSSPFRCVKTLKTLLIAVKFKEHFEGTNNKFQLQNTNFLLKDKMARYCCCDNPTLFLDVNKMSANQPLAVGKS